MALASQATPEPGRQLEPLSNILLFGAAQWYPWAVVAPFIDRIVRRSRVSTARDGVRVLGWHARLLLIFAIAHGATLRAASWINGSGEAASIAAVLLSELVPNAVLYSAVALGFTVAESRRRQTETAERLRAEVAEARLDALRQQLNPHFLFNTLNHIVAEIRAGEVAPAQRMLLALSDLLRDVLRERAQLIPLRDEVRMVERYLEIERERFGDRFQAEVTFEPRALDGLVPSLILQPLVENAVRHGVSTADGRCRIALTVRASADRLTIDVRDAGPGLDPVKARISPGVGLANTAERLKYLYGADHRFEVRSADAGGVQVAIDLPFRRS
jgi:LytS/YehU family sensor histidine kinase